MKFKIKVLVLSFNVSIFFPHFKGNEEESSLLPDKKGSHIICIYFHDSNISADLQSLGIFSIRVGRSGYPFIIRVFPHREPEVFQMCIREQVRKASK